MCSTKQNDDRTTDATEEQLQILRSLGVKERELQGLTFEDAEIMIDACRAMRTDATRS